ncbi:hypothetical protein I4F81_005922 [Pyropia yezoensis]|uniref:Uncharacterized protein n=1 Tax=Pyropia yezoensis TaxID=2788 RepID=A0ACC3BZT8_PYRYE|nr:hypothetical protein I4F81_005922 [Neopyropia yezoensis]
MARRHRLRRQPRRWWRQLHPPRRPRRPTAQRQRWREWPCRRTLPPAPAVSSTPPPTPPTRSLDAVRAPSPARGTLDVRPAAWVPLPRPARRPADGHAALGIPPPPRPPAWPLNGGGGGTGGGGGGTGGGGSGDSNGRAAAVGAAPATATAATAAAVGHPERQRR